MNKSYEEMIKLTSFNERLNYLMTNSNVGFETFGIERYINQALYRSREWKNVRKKIIVRD